MKEIATYNDATDFLQVAQPVLEQEEAVNNFILGIAHSHVHNPTRFGSQPFFAVVKDGGLVEVVP